LKNNLRILDKYFLIINIKIVEIFAYFWECNINDLLVSFDGLSFNLPPTKKGSNILYHIYQSFMSDGFKCIQSFITSLDINDYGAILSFMEGSNKFHTEFKEMYDITDKSDWYKLTKEQEKFYYNKGCSIKMSKRFSFILG